MTYARLGDVAMDEVHLTTPVTDADIARLKLGDVVYLTGILYTAREGVYRKVVDENQGLPDGVRELTNVNFHCSPAATVRADGTYAVEAVTASTAYVPSARTVAAGEQWKLTFVSSRTPAGSSSP